MAVSTVQVGQRLQLFKVSTKVEDVRRYFGVAEGLGRLLCQGGTEVTEIGSNGPYTFDVDLAFVAKNKRTADNPTPVKKRGRPRVKPLPAATKSDEPPAKKRRGRPPKKNIEPEWTKEDSQEVPYQEEDKPEKMDIVEILDDEEEDEDEPEQEEEKEKEREKEKEKEKEKEEEEISEEVEEVEVEEILASGRGEDGEKLYLVKWKGQDVEDTWEPAENLSPELVATYESNHRAVSAEAS